MLKTLTIGSRYERLKSLLATNNRLLVGVGGVTAWPVEATPPDVNPLATTQAELQVYLPVEKYAAKIVPNDYTGPELQVLLGTTKIITVGPNEVESKDCDLLYLRTMLLASDFPEASYRSFGLYEQAVLSPGPATPTVYPLQRVLSSKLFYLEHFQGIDVQPSIEEDIRFLIRV